MTRRIFGLITLSLTALTLQGGTIVSQTSNGAGVSAGTFTFGFNLTSNWSNVSIALKLANPGGVTSPAFTSYLTNQIGPGTIAGLIPVGNEYAPSTNGTFTTSGYYSLFSGLALGPGAYHVTFIPSSGDFGPLGFFGPPLTQVLGSGVSYIGEGTITQPAFPPAGNKTAINTVFNVEITGDQSAVPEPGTGLLMTSGTALLAAFYYKRRRSALPIPGAD